MTTSIGPCPSLAALRHTLPNAYHRCPDCNHVYAVHGSDMQCDLCALSCGGQPVRTPRPHLNRNRPWLP